jgi:predicted transcriptional regulator
MYFIDKILKSLTDSHWHSIEEVEKEIPVPENKFHYALDFLKEQSFVDVQENKIMITSKGLKILELQA